MDLTDEPNEELTCKPLDTYLEISQYLENLPPWTSLCKELTHHSDYKIRNMEINNHTDIYLDDPETFCHFSPDVEDPVRYEAKKLPKTLVCHDMANGYHDDSYIDGTEQCDAYTFYNWAGIDIFCYFSHHLITIPPVGWINVGHAHGVKVIGTVITEWNDGVQFWEKILESETMYQNFASYLVAIAKSLKFDGWLLNVENKIAKPDMLLAFVGHLNFILHQEIPHGELIWYDSVTISGHLNWQNGLNDKNKAFFDACDGIFTNYSWKEDDIKNSAVKAGSRITDVYIGIDVWGRNFYGGGKFNTQQAIKMAYKHGCSLAIFAPAWTHEAIESDNSKQGVVTMAHQLVKGEEFQLRDRALWGSIWPFLNTRLPSELPFKTSFCRGHGKKRRQNGEVICRTPWYNLRHQQYQPNSAHGPHGYLLSTEDIIMHVSRNVLVKDPKGIIRYRESFQTNKLEDDTARAKDVDADRANESSDESDEMDHKSIKRTIKERLLEFFKKNSHTEHPSETTDPPPEPSDPAENDEKEGQDDQRDTYSDTSEEPKLLGRSLLSVTLRLGQRQSGSLPRIALASEPRERPCLELYQEDSFNGGACLRVHPSDAGRAEHRLTRLLHCDFQCRGPLLACVVTKRLPDHPAQYLNVKLHSLADDGSVTRFVLVGHEVTQPPASPSDERPGVPPRGGEVSVPPLDTGGARFRQIQKYILGNEYGFYVPVENAFGWKVRYYEVHMPGARVTSVNVRAGLPRGPVLLGHLGLCALRSSSHPRNI